jgi:hypothetical protein
VHSARPDGGVDVLEGVVDARGERLSTLVTRYGTRPRPLHAAWMIFFCRIIVPPIWQYLAHSACLIERASYLRFL